MTGTGTLQVYRRLIPYLQPHMVPLVLFAALALLGAVLELLTPWPMKILVDSVVGEHPLEWFPRLSANKVTLLILVLAAGIGLRILSAFLKVWAASISVRVRQKTVLDIKTVLFDHLQNQSLHFYDTRRLGDIISRVNNDVWGVDEFIITAMPLLVALTTLSGMLAVMFWLNWQLALVALLILPFFYATYGFYSKRFDKRVDEVQRLEGEAMSIVQEVLSGLRVVKAFTREDHERSRFVRQGTSAAEARIHLTRQQVAYSTSVGLITTAGTVLVTGVGTYQILNGSLTLGELLVVLAYLASVYGPLESINSAATYMHGYIAKMKRIFEILDIPSEVRDSPGAIALRGIRGGVEFDDVFFGYPGRGTVLESISVRVEAGGLIGIVGPTGAGKTTLVSLIPRFYDTSSGRILIDGHDVREIELRSLRKQISIVHQEPILFWGTIRENIGYGKPNAGLEEIVESARLANADDFILQLPDGYETHVGERGLGLSGGEKQRLSIARAFLKNAPILILDEPSSALDARTEFVLLEALGRLMKGRTTFIIAHRLSTLRAADRILVLDGGRVVEHGSHSELLARGGLYSSLYRQQMEHAAL